MAQAIVRSNREVTFLDGLKLIVQFRFLRTLFFYKNLDVVLNHKKVLFNGAVAQLVERLLCKQDVRSSSLLCSTKFYNRTGL